MRRRCPGTPTHARLTFGEGAIFTPSTSAEFKRVLLATMDAMTWAIIIDENPGALRHQINGDYPEGKSFSAVPANILALLPELPDDIQFRFLGRHLILYDPRAHVILDRIPDAIQCTDCDEDRWTRQNPPGVRGSPVEQQSSQ